LKLRINSKPTAVAIANFFKVAVNYVIDFFLLHPAFGLFAQVSLFTGVWGQALGTHTGPSGNGVAQEALRLGIVPEGWRIFCGRSRCCAGDEENNGEKRIYSCHWRNSADFYHNTLSNDAASLEHSSVQAA